MILSRSKPAGEPRPSKAGARRDPPDVEEFVMRRDYVGALTVLEFLKQSSPASPWLEVWTGWCQFHAGEYRAALDTYLRLLGAGAEATAATAATAAATAATTAATGATAATTATALPVEVAAALPLDIAVCYFYLGMYKESQEMVEKAPDCSLKSRLQFHLSHKTGDEAALLVQHAQLRDVPEDQLCLAAVHYLRGHYQEAIDVYKKLLLDKRTYMALHVYVALCYYKPPSPRSTYMALHVYVALCYYKLDYYDVSQEVLGVYLAQHPTSTVALNLKACNFFRLYNGKAAEAELKQISTEHHSFGQDLVRHNLVVFRNGEGALKTLPELVDVIPEARLNLAAQRLRSRRPREARALLEPLPPTSPLHYVLRATLAVSDYNDTRDEEQLRVAQQCFHVVGSSASECDTIPGRQCMASSYFLAGQFEEVLVYLNSIKSFFLNDDTFNFNYAQAKVATGFYSEAQEVLLQIQDETVRASYQYQACLCRCHVMNREPDAAWELCGKSAGTADNFALLQLVANDCYRMGQFLVAAKAFHMLERLDGGPEMWEGLRGAVCGAAQAAAAAAAAGRAAGPLREALALLRSPRARPRAEALLRPIVKWAQQNRIPV